jgi:hypothetical protein
MITTSFIKHISKTRDRKSIEENVIDIQNAYLILTKEHLQPKANGRLYHIVLKETGTNNAKFLNFQLTNKLFRPIHKKLKDTPYYLNYLFVLEYPKKVSTLQRGIWSTDLHAHIAINTNIPEDALRTIFIESFNIYFDFYMSDETERNDKESFSSYLTKQAQNNYFLTHEHYNYNIDYRSPKPRKTTPSRKFDS